MNNYMNKLYVGIMIIFVGLSFGCNKSKSESKKNEVKLTYVEWTSAIASTNVVKAVLEEKLNYNVEATPVTPPMMYEGLKVNEVDVTVCALVTNPSKRLV